jgi:hypothetical protein
VYKDLSIVSVAGMGLVLPALASDREDDIGRVEKATRVFREIMATPDKGIPRDLLEKANALPSFQERRSSPSYLEATTAMGWRPAALTRPTCVWSPTGCTKSAGGQPEKSSSRPEHPWRRRKRNEPAIGAIFCLCAVALDGCHRTFFAEHFEIWFESTGEVHPVGPSYRRGRPHHYRRQHRQDNRCIPDDRDNPAASHANPA